MKHLVQFSTGAGSAEVAWRVVEQHGSDNVTLLTADTKVEDKDNWRFARDVVDRLCCEWIVLADGRTPMQVGRDHRVVPNNRMAVCSRVLKRELLRKWIDTHCDPAETVIYLGFDWTEPDRHDAASPHWQPYRIESPLISPPYVSKPDLLNTFRQRGIKPPRLYEQGFSHANCGGACVRGGQAQWQLLLQVNRPLFLEWEAEEETTRDMLGRDVSILRERNRDAIEAVYANMALTLSGSDDEYPIPPVKSVPLTLRAFRERLDSQPGLFDADDWGACGCTDAFGGQVDERIGA